MTLAETIKTVLEAGTWTNYGSTPNIYKGDEEVGSLDDFIRLEDVIDDPIYAFNHAEIYNPEQCKLRTFTSNSTNRDNINKDLKAIFLASSENILLKQGRPSMNRDTYRYKWKAFKYIRR